MNKERLIELAEELLKEEKLENRTEDLIFLKRQYKLLENQDQESFYDKLQTDKFNALYEELVKKSPKLGQSPADEKKELIELAKNLLDREDYPKASKELDSLTISFKRAGKCSKEQDDELWAEFRAVSKQFLDKRRAFYDEKNRVNSEKRAHKEDIIARAKQVLEVKNNKLANEQMDALFEEWRTIGYSGKDDDEIWKEFSKVRKEFQNKKRENHQEMLKMFEDRANKKEELIKEAKRILADSDFSPEEIQKLKGVKSEFNKVGFAGKEKDDDLNARFNEVIKKYYEEKKVYTL